MVPPHLRCIQNVRLNHAVLANWKGRMQDHLTDCFNSKVILAKDIVCTFASYAATHGSGRGVAEILGLTRESFLGR